VQLIVDDAVPGAVCAACGVKQENQALTIKRSQTPIKNLGLTLILGQGLPFVLCERCAVLVADALQNKVSRNRPPSLSCEWLTSELVSKFSVYSLDNLLDELIMETTRYVIGPLKADARRVALSLMERLATLGIARKEHRAGCEIWLEYCLCKCPWEVPS
jgi:hypothetical protein